MPPEVGLVVSVGKGDGYGYAVEKFATTVLPGDTVFFLRDRAQKIELGEDKVEHFIVKEREVLGIFEKGEYI